MSIVPVIAAGVFLGIVMAASLLWAISKIRHMGESDMTLTVGAAFLVPILFFLAQMFLTGAVPPHLDAVAPPKPAVSMHYPASAE